MSIVSVITIIALCLALAGLAAIAANRARRWVQPLSRRNAKSIQPPSEAGDPKDWERSTALLIIRDAFANRVLPIRTRLHRLAGEISALRAHEKVERGSRNRVRAALKKAVKASAAQRPPLVSALVANLLIVGLLFGDLAVVTMAVQSESADVSPGYAFLAAMAFGLAMFSMGYIPGHFIKNWVSAGKQSELAKRTSKELVVVAVCLLGSLPLVSVALMFLREVREWHWVVLAMTPALGAAAIKMMGPTPEQRVASRLDRKLKRQSERWARARGPIAKLEGRAEALREQYELAVAEARLVAGATLKRLDIDLGEIKEMLDRLGVVAYPADEAQRSTVRSRSSGGPVPLSFLAPPAPPPGPGSGGRPQLWDQEHPSNGQGPNAAAHPKKR